MTVNLLFVCLGNICRSPSAEGIMNHLVQEAGLESQIICDSAGTSGYHICEPPDPRMTAAARKKGIPLGGHSRKVEPPDFERFELILAMDRDNYRTLLERDRTGHFHSKIRLIGGADGFDHVIDLLLDACSGLLVHVTQDLLSANRPG
jgi:protein-tyrosine phosphatase